MCTVFRQCKRTTTLQGWIEVQVCTSILLFFSNQIFQPALMFEKGSYSLQSNMYIYINLISETITSAPFLIQVFRFSAGRKLPTKRETSEEVCVASSSESCWFCVLLVHPEVLCLCPLLGRALPSWKEPSTCWRKATKTMWRRRRLPLQPLLPRKTTSHRRRGADSFTPWWSSSGPKTPWSW